MNSTALDARRLLVAFIGVCLMTAGCATAADAVATPTTADLAGAPTAPAALAGAPATECQRKHVYIFLVNGLDPFFVCKFNKTPDYLRSLGYEHVSFGQLPAYRRFTEDIRHIHADDPLARFVLVGFSLGANNVCRMSEDLKADGIDVDLLVYLGGCLVSNGPEWRPENAHRIVNICDSGLIVLTGGLVRPDKLDGVENIQIPGPTFHVNTPDSQVTQETLANELGAIAAGPGEAKPVPVGGTAAKP